MKKKSSSNPMIKRKTLRFTDDEYEQIEKKLDEYGVSFSDFARSAILGKRIFTQDEKELTKAIGKFGVLYNQHIMLLNRGRVPNNLATLKILERIANGLEELVPK